jgi:hypothetical protein
MNWEYVGNCRLTGGNMRSRSINYHTVVIQSMSRGSTPMNCAADSARTTTVATARCTVRAIFNTNTILFW